MRPSTRSVALTGWRRIPGPPRDAVKARLLRLHVALLRRHRPQPWWPGRTAYEIAVGAILTQNTAWTNAAPAIAALRARRLLDPRRLMAVSEAQLGTVIRSAGTSRLKARRVRSFTRWLLRRFGGRLQGLRRAPLAPLRAEMRAIPGLGLETVDAILLYAAHRPVAVADASTRRLLARHRLLRGNADYETARAFLEAHLPSDPSLFSEFHALVVADGKAARMVRASPAGPRSAPRRRAPRASSPVRPSPSAGRVR
jgi:endonuclease III related protein